MFKIHDRDNSLMSLFSKSESFTLHSRTLLKVRYFLIWQKIRPGIVFDFTSANSWAKCHQRLNYIWLFMCSVFWDTACTKSLTFWCPSITSLPTWHYLSYNQIFHLKNIVKSQIFLDMTKNQARYCHPLMSLSVVGGVSVVVHKLSLKPLGQLEPSVTIQILRSEICFDDKIQ
jgi:hypothetical protein